MLEKLRRFHSHRDMITVIGNESSCGISRSGPHIKFSSPSIGKQIIPSEERRISAWETLRPQ
jgi:hypothetical protein